ncbi:MAG: hypothetical protein AB7K36_12645 [Chloroflexota bacterium]
MAASSFHSEDEEAQHCLRLLRDGTPQEKIGAREQLAAIFLRRGLHEEATELYETNVRAGVRTPELFERLGEAYRLIGELEAADGSLAEAERLRTVQRPLPAAPAPTKSALPRPPIASQDDAPPGRLPDRGPDRGQQDGRHDPQGRAALETERLPAQPPVMPQVTTRLPAASPYDPDAQSPSAGSVGAQARPSRSRGGRALPGPLLIVGLVLLAIIVPLVGLAFLVVNPLALYLEGRPVGPTVDVSVTQPVQLKVAAGSTATWYLRAGRSVSGFWATPGLELTLDQELEGAGTTFTVTPAQPQSWGETITIVERRGQGRANQDAMVPARFAAPATLPPSGTVLPGRITGQITAPRLSESNQFNTTTQDVDLAVQLVVVSAPSLWLAWFMDSVSMFFQDDRWLLVSIVSLLTWCVLAGGIAILLRARWRRA